MRNQVLDDFKFQFTTPAEDVIVPTGMMLEVIRRTAAVHPGNVIWYGDSRVGKTTTAEVMVQKINDAYDPNNPNAYRAVHFEVGEIAAWTGNEVKKGVKSLYYATIGKVDEGVYRHAPTESLAAQLVYGLRRKNIQLIFVDEAGTLSVEAIRGMVLVGNVARSEKHPLSLVFIGMDDLPTKVQHLPQVEKRFVEWCYFEAYSLKETAKLLTKLHPHFAQLDLESQTHHEQIEWVYETFGGFPGLIVPFLKKLDYYQQREREEISVTYLRTIQLRTSMDKRQMIGKSLEMYRGRPPKDSRSGYARRNKQDDPGSSNDAEVGKGGTANKRAKKTSPQAEERK